MTRQGCDAQLPGRDRESDRSLLAGAVREVQAVDWFTLADRIFPADGLGAPISAFARMINAAGEHDSSYRATNALRASALPVASTNELG